MLVRASSCRACKFLATALLQRFPTILLTYPTQHDIQRDNLRELAPFLTEVLQNRRQPKLHLTLQPASSLTDAIEQRGKAEPAAAASDAARLVAWTLGAVPLCGAVDSLTISWHYDLDVTWEPDFSATLAASFPSLTSLTFHDARRQLEVWDLDWVTAAYLPLHSLTHPLHLVRLEKLNEEPTIEVLAAAEFNLCERNKAGLVLDEDLHLSKATVDLLTEQYLSHSRRTAQQPLQSTMASSSSHSGSSSSLASSSSPEGHIMPGGPGSSTGQGGQQGSAARAQPLMQRLGRYVKELRITKQGEAHLSPANQQAIAALFPIADIVLSGW